MLSPKIKNSNRVYCHQGLCSHGVAKRLVSRRGCHVALRRPDRMARTCGRGSVEGGRDRACPRNRRGTPPAHLHTPPFLISRSRASFPPTTLSPSMTLHYPVFLLAYSLARHVTTLNVCTGERLCMSACQGHGGEGHCNLFFRRKASKNEGFGSG